MVRNPGRWSARTLAAGLCAALALVASARCAAPAAPVAAEADAGAVRISDAAGLRAIADDPGGRYVLAADIDLGGAPWTPIDFHGVLDGAGHAVYNVVIRGVGPMLAATIDGNHIAYPTACAGLFAHTEKAAIRDLALLGVDLDVVSDGHVFVGGLVGVADDTAIAGCRIEGRIRVASPAKMLGAGGLVGFGTGSISDCAADVETVLVDTDRTEKSEAFLGGLLACGSADLLRCDVKARGYTTVSGYMHTGGIVGMFHESVHGTSAVLRLQDCRVSAEEWYSEENTVHRDYCRALYGEIPTSDDRSVSGNQVVSFARHLSTDYGTPLLPEKDAHPVYRDVVALPGCTTFGFTTHTCETCGYAFRDAYTAPEHTPGDWTTVREPTYAAPGLRRVLCVVDGAVLEEEEIPRLVFRTEVGLEADGSLALSSLLPEGAPTGDPAWSASDAACVSVDADGTAHGLAPGVATVSAADADGVAFAVFTVVVADRRAISIAFRATFDPASLLPDGMPEAGLAWASSDPGVASVGEDGIVRCGSLGAAVLSATTDGGRVVAEYALAVRYAWWQWIVVVLLFGWIWYA